MLSDIPKIDYNLLCQEHHHHYVQELEKLNIAVTHYGFLIIKNYPMDIGGVQQVFALYKQFFQQSIEEKNKVNMAKTHSNRGWGGIHAEQVNQDYAPDYKEVFDCGPPIKHNHPFKSLPYYAKNIWPEHIPLFEQTIMDFYQSCSDIALAILQKIEASLGYQKSYFIDKFQLPMALLRCNYYPPRPAHLSGKDFGIAPHTDYGCLTLLFTDGVPGLEVELPSKKWVPLTAEKNEIIINFGEMLEIWSNNRIKATPHRVLGTNKDRFSIPFFFNPQYNTIISEQGQIIAGEYLSKRYDETYRHKAV